MKSFKSVKLFTSYSNGLLYWDQFSSEVENKNECVDKYYEK